MASRRTMARSTSGLVPDTYAPIHAAQGHISPVATGLAGLVGGALLGAGLAASRKLGGPPPEEGKDSGKEA